MNRFGLRWICALTFAAASTHAPIAAAEDKSALAEGLFADGVTALGAGRVDEACQLFERAVDLTERSAAGGLLALADCREKQGRPASAWAIYREAFALLHKQGDPRETQANDAAVRLDAVVPHAVVHVAPAVASVEGLRVRRGDVDLPREAWERPLPADPGKLEVVVTAPGQPAKSFELAVGAGPATYELTIEPWPCVGMPCPAKPVEDEPPALRATGIAGVVLGGVGVALLGASLGVAIEGKSQYDDAIADPANECVAGACNARGKGAVDDARALGDAATGLLVAGGVLAAGFVTLLTIDLATRKPQGSAAISFGPQSIRVELAF